MPLLDLKQLICKTCGSKNWDVLEGVTANYIGGLL